MSIKNRGTNLWWIDAHCFVSGEEGRKRELFKGSKAEAQAREIDLKRQLRNEIKVGQPNAYCSLKTLGDILDWYASQRILMGGTYNKTAIVVLKRYMGDVPHSMVEDSFFRFVTISRTQANPATGRPLKGSSVNRYISLVFAAYRLAVKAGEIKTLPLNPHRFPKAKETPRDVVLDDEAISHLVSIVSKRSPHILPVVQYGLQVPCRKGELMAVPKSHLDLGKGLLRLVNGSTKGDRGIWKPIPPSMVDYFRSIPEACPWVFYRVEAGQYLPIGDFKKAWDACRKEAGFPDLRFHDLRHISATNLVHDGTPEPVVNAIAGWSTNMLRTYFHRDPVVASKVVRWRTPGHNLDTRLDTKEGTEKETVEISSKKAI